MNHVLLQATDGSLLFFCPGCEGVHGVPVGEGSGSPRWAWNNDMAKPTFVPSIHINAPGPDHNPNAIVCHSHVVNGKISFCPDSTHSLSGQSVDLPNVDNGWPW